MTVRHPLESTLALHATGDLSVWNRMAVALHLRRCSSCRARVDIFVLDRERHLDSAGDLPPGVNWDRLSAEMAANIRVGLAAGECVSPVAAREAAKGDRRPVPWYGFVHAAQWRPALAIAGLGIVFSAAWWLNMPSSGTSAFGKIWDRAVTPANAVVEYGPVVAASPEGIEFRENGSTMGVSTSAAPASVTVSFGGSASARYVDDDTGQVTIATVYVQ